MFCLVSAEDFSGSNNKPRLVVGDPAPVLHRPAKTARDRDVIDLRQRVRHAKVFIEVGENLLGTIERVTTHHRFAHGGNHAVIHIFPPRGKPLQFARAKDIEITRHRRRGREPNFLAARDFRLFLHRHV